MPRARTLLALLTVAALALVWTGCGSNDNGDSTTAPVPALTDTSQTGTEDNGGVTSPNGTITNGSDSGSAIPPGDDKGKGVEPGDDSGGHGGGSGSGSKGSG
jgi:hypothetical protein